MASILIREADAHGKKRFKAVPEVQGHIIGKNEAGTLLFRAARVAVRQIPPSPPNLKNKG